MAGKPNYHIGLPQWSHPGWLHHVLIGKNQTPLQRYSKYFNSVEGNTTFYGLPDTISVDRWKNEVPDSFNFCFKLPRTITHQHSLRHCNQELSQFFNTMADLQHQIGLISIQLPARFSPQQLPILKQFLKQLPKDWCFSIEVRHIDFFDKGDSEQQFNRLISTYQVNRTMFDTRTLFHYHEQDPATLDALSKKPNVPLHVIATGQRPMMRFISPLNWQLAKKSLEPWVIKVATWIEEGKTPYLFFHTPDNRQAPELAQYFCQQLEKHQPSLICSLDWPKPQKQDCLF